MAVIVAVRADPQVLSIAGSYGLAESILRRLTAVHPDFQAWWISPRGPGDDFIAFDENERVMERMREEAARFPGLVPDGAPGVLVTNGGTEDDWRRRGRIALSIDPGAGDTRFLINDPVSAFASPVETIWGVLKELTRDRGVRLAQTNVRQRVGNELLLYSINRAPFLHREFLGWMGYVSHPLTHAQLPEASRVESHGNGSLILAAEHLDLSDISTIKQVNQVEMRMVDLGLLPVIDPSLR